MLWFGAASLRCRCRDEEQQECTSCTWRKWWTGRQSCQARVKSEMRRRESIARGLSKEENDSKLPSRRPQHRGQLRREQNIRSRKHPIHQLLDYRRSRTLSPKVALERPAKEPPTPVRCPQNTGSTCAHPLALKASDGDVRSGGINFSRSLWR